MKKIISIFLTLSLIVGVFSVIGYARDNDFKFTVTTDTHYQSDIDNGPLLAQKENEYTNGMLNSELYYYATVQGQMNFESKAIITEFLDNFIKSDSPVLLIAGDLTCGTRTSHLEFASMLKDAEKKSGKEIFVINGNHDCKTKDLDKYIDINEFKEIYQDFGYNQASSLEPTSGSYTAELDKNYRLLAIDSCIYGEDDGQITDSVMTFIENEVAKAKSDNKRLITMMHHSILPHFYLQPMFKNYMTYAERFADLGLKYIYTGHIHANDISSAVTDNGNTLYDIQTGSLISYPNAWREIKISDTVDIQSKYIEKIDTSILQDGYTPEQIEKLQNNFSEYSAGFFEAGVCRWLNRYIGSAWKVGRLLKLKEGTVGYELLDSVMGQIGNALTLPIYKNDTDAIDTYEEILALSGKKIPESNYQKLYQPASKIMSGFFHGDEDSKDEVDLVLICLECAIKEAIVNLSMTKSDLVVALGQICKVNFADKVYGNVSKVSIVDTIAETIALSILTSLTDGFTSDLSSPDDINVTLSGYETNVTETNPTQLNTFKKIMAFLKSLISNILNEFKYARGLK